MLWTNNRRSQAAVAAIMGVMLAGTAAAAPLVVRSSGPSAKAYPAGKALADNAKLTLKAGDTIVLLDGKGTRTLSGPGTFSASASTVAAASTGSTLNALVSGGGEKRARIGAVRSASGIDKGGKVPNPWYVDVTRSSNMCIADPANVTLWRPDASKATTLTVAGPGGNTTVDLAAGQAMTSWPAAAAISNGSQYKLSWDGAKAPTNVKFIVVRPATTDMTGIAQSLIEGGCKEQLDLVIEAASGNASHG